MTLEDAIAIKPFDGNWNFDPAAWVVFSRGGRSEYIASRTAWAYYNVIARGLGEPPLIERIADSQRAPTFYSVAKTPTGYEYQRDTPGNYAHLGYPESKGKLP